MGRPSQSWFSPRSLVAVLLACAQVVSLVGFPAVVPSAAQRSRCGGGACGCRTVADRDSATCCCSKPAKTLRLAPVESCCAKPGAKSCCTKPKPEVIWVVGLFAKSCKGKSSGSWIAAEPATPQLAIAVVDFPPVPVDVVSTLSDIVQSRPSVPPDPPPRFPV